MQTHNTNVFEDSYLAPSCNVAPRSFQPVVRINEDGARELQLMRWGLVRAWAKSATAGFSPINAKAETIATSPMFREAFKRRRRLVPADLFYESSVITLKPAIRYQFKTGQRESS